MEARPERIQALHRTLESRWTKGMQELLPAVMGILSGLALMTGVSFSSRSEAGRNGLDRCSSVSAMADRFHLMAKKGVTVHNSKTEDQ